MQVVALFVVLVALAACANAQSCAVANSSKVDCGYSGITEQGCQSKGCCWQPAGQNSIIPWCFFPASTSPPSPPTPIPSGAPFNSTEMELMMGFFLDNINIDGQGGVVASPDTTTPGGSYYYHWMRDAALSMRTLQLVSEFSQIDSLMQSYVGWVLRAQADSDPNGIDVRTEPKFFLPDGGVYTGGWCRPQTDGPALRSTTLMLYAKALIEGGNEAYVQEYLYTGSSAYNGGAIKYDLDWVAANWESNGCDLWEEVQSNDFFWNRINFRRALYMGAAFAESMGDSATSATYMAAAEAVNATIPNHWNGQYVYEATNRPQDTASILGFNNGCMDADPLVSLYMCPGTYEATATIEVLEATFNQAFEINQIDTKNGIPGVMVGRYPGDTYAGGNPWILTTCALAENYYRAAEAALRRRSLPDDKAMVVYRRIFGLDDAATLELKDFALLAANYGDGILDRIHYHVAPYGFHLSEQIDRNTGVELSATDLTWSYGTALKAMYWRGQLFARLAEL